MKLTRLLLMQGLLILTSLSAFGEGVTAAPADKIPINSSVTALPSFQSADTTDYAKDANGATREEQIAKIRAKLTAIKTVFTSAKQSSFANSTANLLKRLDDYSGYSKTCAEREKTTETICREKTNPTLVQAIPVVQAIVTAIGGAKDACSKFAKATDTLNKALVVYQATCATSKAACQSSCAKAENSIKVVRENTPKTTGQGESALNTAAMNAAGANDAKTAEEMRTAAKQISKLGEETKALLDAEFGKDTTTVSSNLQTCKDFSGQLMSAGIGLAGMIKSFGESNKCDTNLAATPGATPVANVDCSLPANQNLTQCICELNPRTVGCATGLNNAANAKSADGLNASSLAPGTSVGAQDPSLSGGGGSDATIAAAEKSGSGSGGGGAGAPSGGSAGMEGGSGGSGGPDSAKQKAGSSLNAAILGGEGGGGGGGGGWGSGEGSAEEAAMRQYLPGGEKDPAGLAGQVAAKEVTSEGGKSNWEKVRERYRDNKPTLLGY